jgi:hypothetical protein
MAHPVVPACLNAADLGSAVGAINKAVSDLQALAAKPAPPADHTLTGWVAVAVVILVIAGYELYRFLRTKAGVAAVQGATAKVEAAVAKAATPLPTTVAQAKAQGILTDVEHAAAKVEADVKKVL